MKMSLPLNIVSTVAFMMITIQLIRISKKIRFRDEIRSLARFASYIFEIIYVVNLIWIACLVIYYYVI